MKHLSFWLPIVAVVIGALIVHAPVVEGWQDWTTGWARYQLIAITGVGCVLVFGGLLVLATFALYLASFVAWLLGDKQ